MLHLVGAVALMLGLLLQVTQYNQALAAPQNQGVQSLANQDGGDIAPAPVQVVVLGDFQTQLGCGSFDLNCGATQLQNQGGLWTGSIPIPPGNYSYQIGAIGADGGQYIFGQGGLDGDADSIDIDDGQAGAFFSFNASTYEIRAEALDALYVLNTDFGTLPLGPDDGDLSAIVFAQGGGSLNFQLLVNGEPAGDPQSVNLEPGPNRITVSTDGSVQNVESLGYATLTITRLDNGQAAAGGCYQVRDGDLVGQGCDIDDGSADGNTTVFFAEGLDSGGYSVQEVVTPDGIDTAEDQDVELENGDNSVEIQTGGGEVLEPTEEGDDPLTPSDDGEGDGEDGGEVLQPTEEDGGEDLLTPSDDGEDEETPEEDQQAGPGDLIVTLQDGDENPIGAACFQLLNDNGDVIAEACDTNDDFPNNGNSGFFGVPAGVYTLHQSEAPEGTEPAEDELVEINEGQTNRFAVTVDVASPEPTETPETPEATEEPEEQFGDVVIIRQDQDGNPLGGACFVILDQDGNQITDEVCDEDGDIPDDGRTGFFGLPAGTLSLRETRTPENVEPADDQQIDVQADQATEVEVRTNLIEVDEPEEETPTEEVASPTEADETPAEDDGQDDGEPASGPPGDLIVTLQDENGQPIGGACFELLNPDGSSAIESCDINDDFPNNGNTGFFGLPSGNYTLHQSEVPEGTQPIEDQPITVDPGQSRTDIIQTSAQAQPEDEEQPTEQEQEPTPTEESDSPTESGEDGGIVRVDVTAFAGDGETICVELNTGGLIGISDPPSACDNEEGDANGDEGIIELTGVPAGEYQIQITQGPDEALNAELLPVTVGEDGSGEATFEAAAPEVGTLQISLVDDQGNPIAVDGSCVRVEELDIEVCDNSDPDSDPETGSIVLADIPFGSYTIGGTFPPEGFDNPVDTSTAEVATADEPGTATVTFPAQAPETGTVSIVATDDNDQPIGGACWSLSGDGGEFGPLCDDDANGGTANDGEVTFSDVPAGTYTLSETTVPDGYQPVETLIVPTVDVAAGENEPVRVPHQRQTGSLQISLTADDNPLTAEGACISITELDREICDNGDGDADPATGSILIEDVPFGGYTITGSTAPEGFDLVDQPVSVTVESAEAPAIATVQFALQGPDAGTIAITVVDDATDQPIAAGCFDVTNDSGTFNFCDDDGDGTIQIPDVAFGTQTVTQTSATDGYAVDPDAQQLDVTPNAPEATAAFRNAQSTGSISVIATGNDDQPIGGACWTLTGDNGEFGPICDDESNGGTADDGEVTFSGIPAGTYSIVETTPPSGYGLADPRDVDLAPGDNAPLRVPHAQAPLTVSVSTSDGAGGVPTGACYAIDGGEPLCDQDGDGIVNFENVAPGPHRFEQTTAPAGFQPVEGQDVEIVPGEVESVVFTNTEALTGSLLITVNDPAGNPVGDVCATIAEGQTICDGVTGDDADADGQILISDLEPGDYSVTLGNLPQDLTAPAEATPVTVTGGEQATLQIDLVAAPEQTGTVEITLEDAGGNAVEDGCAQLTNSAAGVELGPFCDNGDEDTNPDPGVLTLEGIDTGTYLVSVPTEDGTGGGEFAASSTSSSRTIQVQANVIVVVVIIVIGQPLDGSLQINTRAAGTLQLLGGACYDIQRGNQTISVCDNDDSDANGVNGIIRINDLFVEGTYSIELSNDIPGYAQETVPEVEILSGQLSTVNVDLVPVAQSGTVIVNKVDDNGDPLGNSCFALRLNGANVAEICDSDDDEPNDGQLIFADVPTGSYRLIETQTPSADYQAAPSRQISVVAGQPTELTIVNEIRTADLIVRKVAADSTSTLLQGACFSLQNDDGDIIYGSFCDGDDRNTDGRIRFNDVVPGDYVLVEDVAPYGYARADSRDIAIQPGVTQVVTIQNEQLPPPAETGTLIVYKQDGSNQELPGACFRLYDGNTPLTNTVCDGTDGSNDGTVQFAGVAVGTWELRETIAPSDAYAAAAPQDVEIGNDETTEVTVVNQLKTGRIRIEKTNTSGSPLQNACFDVLEDSAGQECTNAAGEVVFDNLPPGSYTLRETQAPYGYVTIKDRTGIVVYAGRTTVVDVVNQRIPPDPDTGSVQVLKFYCPAGEAGERTVFLGGAAGNAELAKTAGCEQGNAQFDLTQDDGSGGPGVFTTGNDGKYQVSVPSGTYSLEETDPDLEGNSSVRLVVYRNQLTTVVVINYIEPPEPDPITVNVTKWTCDPSFNGTLYDDFAQNCTAETQLTNNITFRAQGPANQKHVTGDGGQVGRTAFTDLTAGTYTIFEETPYDIPTSYGFCGYDAGWPADFKTVNGAFNLKLDWGETVTCHFFNIPEDVTDTTGVVLVRKFVCDIESAPKGYDWFEECGLSDQNAKFALNSYNAEMQQFQEFSQGTANDDGFLRFTKLRPGTYELKEIDDTWCHAESDSVDSKGNVVVKANQVSTVWIFNCVPTENPPNTGSGDAAGALDPRNGGPEDGGLAPVVTPAISIGWPLVLAAAWLTWRKMRTMPDLRPVRAHPPYDRIDRHRRAA